jgi:hypothetical protein
VVLGLVVSLSYVTVMEQKMSQKTKSSVGAFYSSESGIEWALNKIANQANPDTTTIDSAFTGLINGQSANCPPGIGGPDVCSVYFLGSDGKVLATSETIDKIKAVRSVGTNQSGEPTQRAIEAAVASSDISFTYYCYDSSDYATPVCSEAVGPQKHCPSGYNEKVDLGDWGYCTNDALGVTASYFLSPTPGGGVCGREGGKRVIVGNAYVCSQ